MAGLVHLDRGGRHQQRPRSQGAQDRPSHWDRDRHGSGNRDGPDCVRLRGGGNRECGITLSVNDVVVHLDFQVALGWKLVVDRKVPEAASEGGHQMSTLRTTAQVEAVAAEEHVMQEVAQELA